MERALHPPDFALVASNFREAADHFDRAATLPAVDGGAQLLTQMEAVVRRIAALEQTMTDRFDRVETKLETLERRMGISETNGVARVQNSTAIREDSALIPLLSVNTNREIEDFPGTVQVAGALSAREVDRILREMGATLFGDVRERRRRMLLAIGVTTRAV